MGLDSSLCHQYWQNSVCVLARATIWILEVNIGTHTKSFDQSRISGFQRFFSITEGEGVIIIIILLPSQGPLSNGRFGKVTRTEIRPNSGTIPLSQSSHAH